MCVKKTTASKLIVIIFLLALTNVFSQTNLFEEVTDAGFTGVEYSSLAWGDYDNDGDLDLVISGSGVTKLYNNDLGIFTEVTTGAAFTGVSDGQLAWGDYDNDGDLDLVISGSGVTKLYNNDTGIFTEATTGADFRDVERSSLAWGDYDNDGDLDLVISGYWANRVSELYDNNSGTFSKVTTGADFTGVDDGSLAWGDYDNDGDLDVVISGWDGSGTGVTKLYKNDSGTFTEVTTGADYTGVWFGSLAWGDYDNDGDLDLAVSGYSSSEGRITKLYKNSGGNFEDANAGFTGVYRSSLSWGDYDNDGDLDLVISGSGVTKLYNNDSDIFTEVTTGADFTGVKYSSLTWGDYDNDGDLDLLISGIDENDNKVTKLYKNNSSTTNLTPNAPTNLSTVLTDTTIVLSWDAATDNSTKTTPQEALTYNIRIGTTPGGNELMSGMSITDANNSGKRMIAAMGNVQLNNEWILDLDNIESGKTYYWSVQAIDNGYLASEWSEEKTFEFTALFTEVTTGGDFTGLYEGSLAWIDYDNDGDLDLVIAGEDQNDNGVTKLYNNDSGTFTEVTIGDDFTSVDYSSLSWGDYDNDGDLDLVISGWDGPNKVTKLYNNNSVTFTEVTTGADFTSVDYSSLSWGDYDNDGDLDLVISGTDSNRRNLTKLYRNNLSEFTEVTTGADFTGVSGGQLSWGDYDNDGDLDLAVSGYSSNYITKLYKNSGGNFEDANAGFTGVDGSSLSWGDYDNDGDLDLVVSGFDYSKYNPIVKLYNNDSGIFTEVTTGADFTGVWLGSIAWGDYDNDGDLDLVVSGNDSNFGPLTKLYNNDYGTFTVVTIGADFTNVHYSSLAWGDYDNDGDLDLVISGATGDWPNYNPITKLYKNNSSVTNTKPISPVDLSSSMNASSVILSWGTSSDNETSAAGLTYNIRIGTTPGGSEILPPHSFTEADSLGKRKIVSMGNVQQNTSWRVKNLASGTYYWSVQAVDNGFASSEWADVDTFSITVTDVEELSNAIPENYSLTQNYPNPFNPNTQIEYSIKESGFVKLSVYNLLGELVETLVSENQKPGTYKADFNAANLSSGIYFYRIQAKEFVEVKKMILLK